MGLFTFGDEDTLKVNVSNSVINTWGRSRESCFPEASTDFCGGSAEKSHGLGQKSQGLGQIRGGSAENSGSVGVLLHLELSLVRLWRCVLSVLRTTLLAFKCCTIHTNCIVKKQHFPILYSFIRK